MAKTPVAANDSGADHPRPQPRPCPRVRTAAADHTGFDVDSWEPSLLERMLKANGRKQQND